MMGSHMKTGTIVLQRQNKFTDDEMQFWEAYLSQISGRFEREMLNSIAQKAFILDESDKLYKTLFNSISHEFRIPVTTILGATDTLMSEQYSVEIQQQLLAEINIASIRLNQLIENLLNISRLESGHLTLRTNWYDFHDLIDKVTNTLKQELQHYNLIVNIPDDLPMVKIDFGLIEQAMHNLLLNITQYVPQNTDILIDVQLSGDVLNIKLTDQGAGFSPDNIEHVFDKFYRGKSAKTGGTGLGLSIVKGFIEAHKGQVIAYNHPSKGAVFEIEIPVEISNINYIEKLS
jgi:two-component system sensor histidine kinase KdpD